MKLMYSPGACSVGIHVLLEEIGKPYEAQLVNLREGAQFKPEFTSVNPKSKVPTMVRDDGSVLTEYPGDRLLAGAHQSGQEAVAGRCGEPDARHRGARLRGRHHPHAGFLAAVPRLELSRRIRRTRTR